MKYKHIENISIAVTVIMFGIMAGFFWTYTFNVNIAMLQVDGPTYGRMQSLFNQNVRHVMFFLFFFFGAGAASFLTVIVNYKHFRKVSFWLCALSSIIYIFGIIVFTAQVNLPLNYYTESWDLLNLPQDWEQTRESWNQANAIRVGTSFISFILAVCALTIRRSSH